VPLAFKVDCPSSGVGCDIALVILLNIFLTEDGRTTETCNSLSNIKYKKITYDSVVT
jgi:hypothetical protein